MKSKIREREGHQFKIQMLGEDIFGVRILWVAP